MDFNIRKGDWKMGKIFISCLFFAILLVAAPMQGLADEVAINFVDGWPLSHLAGETADGFSNWTDSGPITDPPATDLYNTSSGPLTLDNSNNLVSVEWASVNTWYAGPEGTSDEQLYRTYLDDGETVAGTGIGANVTITGLSAWLTDVGDPSYQIRFYHSTDQAKDFLPVSIRDGSAITDTVIETVQATNMWYPGGNSSRAYVDSSDTLTTDIITITLPNSGGSGNLRATLAGVKITSVPEPMTLSLLGIGGLALVRKRRNAS
jgi:hypothetical protein